MGDRTTATVSLSKRDYEYIKNLPNKEWDAKGFDEYMGVEDKNEYENIVELIDYQANYGMWDRLTDVLCNEGIEHDHYWESGGDYGAGCKYVRLVNGELNYVEQYQEQESEANLVKNLKELLDENNMDEVKTKIENLFQEYFPFEITPLGRSNSVEFIKEG